MEHLLLKAAVTAATDEGVFEAVISTATVDRERDIVDPNGMVDALHKWVPTGKKITLAWNHSTSPEDQIGYIDPASARAVGDEVWAKGWIDQSTDKGREAWRLVKAGVMGFSFGYLILKAAQRQGGGRNIKELDVFEITATPTPMNNDTRVLAWKSLPNAEEQRRRAQQVTRQAEEDQIPDIPAGTKATADDTEAQEPEPEPEPEPLEIPDAESQRKRAESIDSEIRRRAEEERIPAVSAEMKQAAREEALEAVESEPEPEPEPPVIPNTAAQRKRAESISSEIRRRAEEERLPAVSAEMIRAAREAEREAAKPEPVKEEPPVPPDAGSQRKRAESISSEVRRRAEEERLPAVSAEMRQARAAEVAAAKPASKPEPPVVPDAESQRKRAEQIRREMRRRAEEERLPAVSAEMRQARAAEVAAAKPASKPEPPVVPDAESQRKRAEQIRRHEEEERRLPAVTKAITADPVTVDMVDEEEVDVDQIELMLEIGQAFLDDEDDQADAQAMREILNQLAQLRLTEANEPPDGKALRRRADKIELEQATQGLKAAISKLPGRAEPTEDLPAGAAWLFPDWALKAARDGELKAVWTTATINNLPDTAFLYIENGGTKDADGKTTPRSLRHFPYKDSNGAVDIPHLRNALARIPQSNLSQSVKDRLTAKAQRLLDNTKSVVEETAQEPTRVRAVDPLRRKADALALDFMSDGQSQRKPPQKKKVTPQPSPEMTLEELKQRTRDITLIALSGVEQP